MGNFIASKEEEFSKWYLDIVHKAKLVDYAPVKGCMVIMPYGYAIWERIQIILNDSFQKTGHKNAYFPLLIPYEFFEREKEHVKGFSPEVAVVTTAGGEELSEPLVLRPTSETIIWNMYSRWVKSYRDLPIKINQWANIIRWEKRTKPFLRTTEFLWQEGHTAHETEKEAQEETLFILNIYKRFIEDYLAIPVFCGKKTEREKFAGAVSTYTLEALMQDKKALQAGTSHYLGSNFAEAFDVKFQNNKGEMDYVFATSWGISTRLIGALIMVHSDNKGLILPPKIAPVEIIIVPIFKIDDELNKRILEYSTTVFNLLNKEGFRVDIDRDVKNSPGFRFADAELKGIPMRIEIGSNDILMDCVTVARRDKDKNAKYQVSIKELALKMKCELEDIQSELFKRALEFRNLHTKEIIGFKKNDYDIFKTYINENLGFVLSSWCGNEVCEESIKNDTKATIRCIPEDFQNRPLDNLTCIYCNTVAQHLVLFARSY
ncbi:proline--tRNA ligase [Borrelia sp. HM]|uniref:proline--tRNA ligase n=1 Tax=Borrelia sp. HM TaxID=1882662 RepID=UPI001C76C68F|nr:proline--tRNA ligase [Borrelia sp. HM]BCR21832.1 Proline--tRNA ligase [Borrelia sp. HM]